MIADVGGGNGGLVTRDEADPDFWTTELVDCSFCDEWFRDGVPGVLSGLLFGSGGPGVPTSDL